MDRLVFAVLSDSLSEIRRVPARCGRDAALNLEKLRAHFSVWERGVLLNAACFLLDFPRTEIDIPLRAFTIARQVLAVESSTGCLEELAAAAMAGAPWRGSFQAACLHCGRSGTWRPMLASPEIAPEIGWRYERPENHIPLCRRCVSRLAYRNREVQVDLARALWGLRFESLLAWHTAISENSLPPGWDRTNHPLWPEPFGGLTWRSGSGALECSEPQMYYGVQRTALHRERLAKYLGKERADEIMQSEPSPDSEVLWPRFDPAMSQAV